MTQMNNKTLDLNAARASYGTPNYNHGRIYVQRPGGTMDYAHAYVASNEDLRDTTGLTRDIGKRVLTVAASGDHPLFYALNGATKIDTFDVTFGAKAIMDIKTQAISQGMKFADYQALLNRLHFAPSASQVQNMPSILANMPQDSAKYIYGMDGYKIFGNGLNLDYYTQENFSEAEYEKLQAIIKKPFNFIWTNIAELNTYLNDEYDVINLSNIFEWHGWTTESIIQIIKKLHDHIRVNGQILLQTGGSFSQDEINRYIKAQEKLKDWAKIGINRGPQSNVIILERTR
ncbi:MAG: hypothetical protein IJD52_00675 [Alphaproteobacteria bacterium]|nr:hypothetical protein [Alphaproteobacteria bacterium]